MTGSATSAKQDRPRSTPSARPSPGRRAPRKTRAAGAAAGGCGRVGMRRPSSRRLCTRRLCSRLRTLTLARPRPTERAAIEPELLTATISWRPTGSGGTARCLSASADRIAPDRGPRDRMPPERPLGRPAEPAPESWTSGLARPVTSPGFPRPDLSRPPTSRHGITQPNAASTTSAWPASPARPDQAGPRHGQDTGGWPRPAGIGDPSPEHSSRHLRPPQAGTAASLAAAGRAAAQAASDQDLGLERPGGRAASRRTAATAAVPTGNTAVLAPARTAPGGTAPAKSRRKNVTSRKATRRKVRHPVRLVVGGGAVAVVAAAGAVFVPHMLKQDSGPAHSISTPSRLQSYVQDPALAASMGATALRAEIERRAAARPAMSSTPCTRTHWRGGQERSADPAFRRREPVGLGRRLHLQLHRLAAQCFCHQPRFARRSGRLRARCRRASG